MKAWAPTWDDDLPAPPDVENDPTPTPEGEGVERGPRGRWVTEYRANRSHECDRRSPYCPGEICKGELYRRDASLERPKGPSRRGTVTVTRTCQHCTEMPT